MTQDVHARLTALRIYRSKVEEWGNLQKIIHGDFADDPIMREASGHFDGTAARVRSEISEMTLVADRYMRDAGVEAFSPFEWGQQALDAIDSAIGEYKRRAEGTRDTGAGLGADATRVLVTVLIAGGWRGGGPGEDEPTRPPSVWVDKVHEFLREEMSIDQLRRTLEELNTRRLLRWSKDEVGEGEVQLSAAGWILAPELALSGRAGRSLPSPPTRSAPPTTAAPTQGGAPAATPSTDKGRSHVKPADHSTDDTQTLSLLFLDVHGWSKLGPREIREYVRDALPAIEKRLAGASFKNTWGDGIVATFGSAKAAALVALDIRDLFVRRVAGIAEEMTCRISLHQGDVFLLDNPIRGGKDIFGETVHLAARLEPATVAGYVFATRPFVEGLKQTKEKGSPSATSLGVRPLPKDYGSIEMFVVFHPGDHDPSERLRKELDATAAPPPPRDSKWQHTGNIYWLASDLVHAALHLFEEKPDELAKNVRYALDHARHLPLPQALLDRLGGFLARHPNYRDPSARGETRKALTDLAHEIGVFVSDNDPGFPERDKHEP